MTKPIRIPEATKDAMLGVAIAKVGPMFAGKQDCDIEEVCRVAVDAAIVELERRLNIGRDGDSAVMHKPTPSPMPAGGNLFETGPTALGGPREVLTKEAVARGYSGEACVNCGNFRVKRTATCLTCQDCGHNKGCD